MTARDHTPAAAGPSSADDDRPSEETPWQRRMLYHQRVRTQLNNERKYLGWVSASLAMVTLGFVVERLDVFLSRAAGGQPVILTPVLRWTPLLVYVMGAVMIAMATGEYFTDRQRFADERPRRSWFVYALVCLTAGTLAALLALLLLALNG